MVCVCLYLHAQQFFPVIPQPACHITLRGKTFTAFWQVPRFIKRVIIGICLHRVHGAKAEGVNQNKASARPSHPRPTDRNVRRCQMTSSVLDQLTWRGRSLSFFLSLPFPFMLTHIPVHTVHTVRCIHGHHMQYLMKQFVTQCSFNDDAKFEHSGVLSSYTKMSAAF